VGEIIKQLLTFMEQGGLEFKIFQIFRLKGFTHLVPDSKLSA